MSWETEEYNRLVTKFGEITSPQIERIKKQDALCVECLKGDKMLCDGIRPNFITAPKLDFPLFRLTTCTKYEFQTELVNRQDACGIPASYIEKRKDLPKTVIDRDYCYNGISSPMNSRMSADVSIEEVFDRVLSAIDSGYTGRLLSFPVLVNKLKNWRTFLSDNVDLDLLVIHRFDMGSCPEFIADYFNELVNLRRLADKVTIFVINDQTRARNEKDALLLTEVSKWHLITV